MDMDAIKDLMRGGDIAKAREVLSERMTSGDATYEEKTLYGTCCHLLGDDRTFIRIDDELQSDASVSHRRIVRKYHALRAASFGAAVLLAVGTQTLAVATEPVPVYGVSPDAEEEYYTLYNGASWQDDEPEVRTLYNGADWHDDEEDDDDAPQIPSQWRSARVLRGVYGDVCSEACSGTCELKCGKVDAKGAAKVTLAITPFSGKKISYGSGTAVFDANGTATVSFKGKYQVAINADDSFSGGPIYSDTRPACSPNAIWNADVGGSLDAAGLQFWCDAPEFPVAAGYEILDYLLPDGTPVGVKNGTKFSLNGTTKVAYSKDPEGEWGIFLPTCVECNNFAGLKLTYTSKTGVFKGSYTVYASNEGSVASGKKPTLKKYKVSVAGVMIDGEGTGTASAKVGGTTYTWAVGLSQAD